MCAKSILATIGRGWGIGSQGGLHRVERCHYTPDASRVRRGYKRRDCHSKTDHRRERHEGCADTNDIGNIGLSTGSYSRQPLEGRPNSIQPCAHCLSGERRGKVRQRADVVSELIILMLPRLGLDRIILRARSQRLLLL